MATDSNRMPVILPLPFSRWKSELKWMVYAFTFGSFYVLACGFSLKKLYPQTNVIMHKIQTFVLHVNIFAQKFKFILRKIAWFQTAGVSHTAHVSFVWSFECHYHFCALISIGAFVVKNFVMSDAKCVDKNDSIKNWLNIQWKSCNGWWKFSALFLSI